MKRISGVSLPHPVLGLEENFVDGIGFTVSPGVNIDSSELCITHEDPIIDDDFIRGLYDSGQLMLVYTVSCSCALFSMSFFDKEEIRIPIENLAHYVEVEIYLVARENIANYRSENFHPDFFLGDKRRSFSVNKHDVVGMVGNQFIPFNKSYLQGASSMFEFNANDSSENISFDYDEDKIIVYYPNEEEKTDLIKSLRYSAKFTMLNLLLLPALHFALLEMREKANSEELEEFLESHHWARTIDECDPDWNRDCLFTSAQKVVRNILTDNKYADKAPILYANDELFDLKSENEN